MPTVSQQFETERVAKIDMPSSDYALKVSVLGGRWERFVFDLPKLRVGRALDCDLRIEHACIGRHQFTIERSLSTAGDSRFRIVPVENATNPTFVNDHPAVEGALKPGDTIAIGEVRIHFERNTKGGKKDKAAAWDVADEKRSLAVGGKPKEDLTPTRMVLLALVVLMGAVVTYLFVFADDDEDTGDVTQVQTPLFGPTRAPHCGNPLECDVKAHESYDKARKLMTTAAADPGNLYRATLEYGRAKSYREQSGRPLADIADVAERETSARHQAESMYEDAKFALKRAIAAGDLEKQRAQATLLAHIVPDERHPYRVKLDAYRRTLPKPHQKSAAEATGESEPK